MKAKKRQAREERRDDRKARKNDPAAGPNDWLADQDYINKTAGLPPTTSGDGRAARSVAEKPTPSSDSAAESG